MSALGQSPQSTSKPHDRAGPLSAESAIGPYWARRSGHRELASICPLSAKTGLKLRRGCTPSASRERLRLRPRALRFVCRSISRPPPYAGRLVDAACWSDGAKFSLPLDSDGPGPCAGGSGADAGRARTAEQLSTCPRRIRSRRAEPDAGQAEHCLRSARARARADREGGVAGKNDEVRGRRNGESKKRREGGQRRRQSEQRA